MDLGIADNLLEHRQGCGELAVPAFRTNTPHDRVGGLEHAIAHTLGAARTEASHDPLSCAHPTLGKLEVLDLLVEVDDHVAGVGECPR